MSEETADALRKLADKVFEQMGEREAAKAADPNGNGHHAEPASGTNVYTGEVMRLADYQEPPATAVHAEPEPTAPAPAHRLLSSTAAATLGPEHTTVTPLRSPVGVGRELLQIERPDKSRTLTVPAPSAPLDVQAINKPRTVEQAKADNHVAQLAGIIVALQDMAVNGEMPSINVYHLNKPSHLPLWSTIKMRWPNLKTWGDLAARAGLAYDDDRRKPRRATVEAQEDASDDDDKPSHRQTSPARRAQLDELKRKRHVEQDARERQGRKGLYQPSREEVVAQLKKIAMGGVAPTVAQFDATRPANWAAGWAQVSRLKVSWEDLRIEAELKPRRGQ